MVQAILPVRSIIPFSRGIVSPLRARKIARAFQLNNLASVAYSAIQEPVHFHPINATVTANTLNDKPYTAPSESISLYFNKLDKATFNLKSKNENIESAIVAKQSQNNEVLATPFDDNIGEKHYPLESSPTKNQHEFFMQQSLLQKLGYSLDYLKNFKVAYSFV